MQRLQKVRLLVGDGVKKRGGGITGKQKPRCIFISERGEIGCMWVELTADWLPHCQ